MSIKYHLAKVLVFSKWYFTFAVMISVDQLNRIRKEKKVSIKAIAGHIKLSRQQCTNILTGVSSMKVEQLIEISNFIGIEVNFTYK